MELKQVLYCLISHFLSLFTSLEVNIGQFLLLMLLSVKYTNSLREELGEKGRPGRQYAHTDGK